MYHISIQKGRLFSKSERSLLSPACENFQRIKTFQFLLVYLFVLNFVAQSKIVLGKRERERANSKRGVYLSWGT